MLSAWHSKANDLFTEHQAWALSLIRKGSDEDIRQEALLALWRAARAFNPVGTSNSASFKTFAYKRVSGAIKRALGRERLPLADTTELNGGLDPAYQQFENRDQAQRILKLMVPQTRRALKWYYLKGLNLKRVGKKMGITPTRAWQLIQSQRGTA